MKISLSAWDMAYEELVELAGVAEESGCYGIWLGDHVVVPGSYTSHHPTHGTSGRHTDVSGPPLLGRDTHLQDPLLALAGLAGATRTLALSTGIYVVPLRHPLVVARSAITLQEVAEGRLRLGVGAGWLEEEFEILGQDFSGRGRRLDDTLEVLDLACRGGPFDYEGRHYSFCGVQLSPRPVPVPIVYGGNSPVAMRRAARVAREWFASGTPSPDEAMTLRTQLLRRREREHVDMPLSCIVRVPGLPDPDLVARYERAGFDEIVLWADQVWVGEDRRERGERLRRTMAELVA